MGDGRAAFAGTKRFQIRHELGSGGMGVVYEAFDREKRVPVALKTLRRTDIRNLERFKREFRALQGLEHANLVSLGELLEVGGEWFFTMELVVGCDFLSYVWSGHAQESSVAAPSEISRRSTFPPEAQNSQLHEVRLRACLRQIAEGLTALHGRGLVHRDIKPSNILVTPTGRTVLMDFGLITEADKRRQSTAAQIVGTPAYMAPEQAQGHKVDAMADWYSVGVLLYEALTGRLPFDGSSMNLMIDKLQYEATPPRALVPHVPPDLDELCVGLLRRERANRPSPAVIARRLGIDAPKQTAAVSPGAPSVSGTHSVQLIPFVGRGAELAFLQQAFDAVQGKPIVVLVEGESGMGKSSLVEHFAKGVADQVGEALVLTGRCYEREQVPYKAFDGVADTLCRFLLNKRPADVAWAMPLHPGLLSLLFPVLRRVEGIARAPFVRALPDPQLQRTRMFSAFRELLQRVAQRRRLIVVLDDLQWACADSLTLFEEVFGHEDAPPALVLATLRPVADHKRRPIQKAMEMVPEVRKLSVDFLSMAQTQQLATLLMLGRTEADIESLVRETRGHPLFVHELARHSQTTGQGMSLDAALQARMVALEPPARALLRVLCIAGRPITQEVATLAAKLDGTAFPKASSVLRVAYLARTDGTRIHDTIGPYHDRVQEVFVATLSEAERVATHDALAAALERTGGDPRAIVRHAIAAGMAARAATYAEEAAHRAKATMAFDQAAEFYETALTVGTHDRPTQLRLRLARAETLKSAGRGREAAEAFVLAAVAAEAAKAEHTLSVHCRIQAVEQWLVSGHLDEGFAASTALLAGIGEPSARSPKRALASLLWNRACLWADRERYPEQQESEIDRETLNRLDVLRAMAMGLTFTDLVRGADFSARFLLHARRAGEPARLVQGLGVEAAFLSAQGRRTGKRSRILLEQMHAIAKTRPEDDYVAGYLAAIDGIVCMNEGRFSPATALMERAEQIFVNLKSRNMLERNAVQMFRMVTLRLGGRIAACRKAMAAFLRDAHRSGDTYFETTLRAYRTQDLLASDKTAEAADCLARASWTPIEKGFHLQHYFALDARAELGLYERSAAAALLEFERDAAHLERSLFLRNRLLRVVYRWLHGRLLLSAVAGDANRIADLRAIHSIAGKLSGERMGCASVFALLLKAGHTALKPRSNQQMVIDLLRQSISLAQEQQMACCAAAAQYRLGKILGAEEGTALSAEADAWCQREGIVDPERYFEVIAPGFPASLARASTRP